MTEKTNSLVASNFRFINAVDNSLHFLINATGDHVVDSFCRQCPVVRVCFGEKGQYSGSVRVSLDAPLVRNLQNEIILNIPCGAGIEIIERRLTTKTKSKL